MDIDATDKLQLITVENLGAGRRPNLLFFAPSFAAGSVLKILTTFWKEDHDREK